MGRLANELRSTDIPISDDDESVVIGIHQRGLLVQSLPRNGQDSRFYLLDKDSKCITGQSKFTFRVTDVHVLHVFIRIHSVERIHNALVHEAQIEQKSHDPTVIKPPLITVRNVINARVEYYSMDSDLLRDNCPLIRGSHHTRTRKQVRKERRRLRNRLSNISVSIVQHNKVEILEVDEDPFWIPFDSDLVALVVEEKDHHGLIRVVGTPSHRDFLAKPDIEAHFNQNQFIKAKHFQADSFFELSFMFDTLCVIKNYEIERLYKERQNQNQIKYEFYQQKMLDGLNMQIHDPDAINNFKQKCLLLRNFANQSPPIGDCFLYQIQKLTRDEEDKIRSCCREKEYVHLEEAKLLIRDPAIAINRNKSYLCKKESREFSIVAKIEVVANGRLQLNISSTETSRILRHDTPWREGADMKIWHRIFERQKKSLFGVYTKCDANVIVDEIINSLPDGGAKIYLRPAKQCKDLFDILKQFNKKIRGEAKVGPSERDSSAENEIVALLRFPELLKTNRTLFDHFRCFAGAKTLIFMQNPAKKFKDKISASPIRLDESQQNALTLAFCNTGIICIQAPPGSGKTMVIGSLINNLQVARRNCRVVLTATTNKAVNNAVEKAVNLEINGGKIDLSITRETSTREEIEITDNIRRYVLLDQALRRCVEPTAHPMLQEAGKEYFKVKQLYEAASNLTEKLSLFEMKHDAESNLKRYYLTTEAPFVGASTPAIMIRHAEHYNRVIDAKGATILRPMKHLIVDEASQLPYYTHLALCCAFNQLESITIIGDRCQLGPHCTLSDKTTLLYTMCSTSELDRMKKMSDDKEAALTKNYRSHRLLVKHFLKPVYRQFTPALEFFQRDLAFKLELPMIHNQFTIDHLPVAFVNIESGGQLHNDYERKYVEKLVVEIVELGVMPAEITVLCFHRKQKEDIDRQFKSTPMLRKVVVSTVNSYQGRENKVVIVCTTKTLKNHTGNRGAFQFVSDMKRGIVALSRAKEAIYVFGQWQHLRRTLFWKQYAYLLDQHWFKLTNDEYGQLEWERLDRDHFHEY